MLSETKEERTSIFLVLTKAFFHEIYFSIQKLILFIWLAVIQPWIKQFKYREKIQNKDNKMCEFLFVFTCPHQVHIYPAATRRVTCLIFRWSCILSSETEYVLPQQASIFTYWNSELRTNMTDKESPYLLYTGNINQYLGKGYEFGMWKNNSSLQLLMKNMGKYSFFCLHSFITHLTRLITLEKIKKACIQKRYLN